MEEKVDPRSCRFFTKEFQKKYFLPKIEVATDHGSSWVMRWQPLYIIYRFIWLAFWIAILIYDFVQLPASGSVSRKTFFIYLTNWDYFFILIGSFFRLMSSIMYACSSPDGTAAKVIYKIDYVIYSIYTPVAVFVSLVYWGFLRNGENLFLDIATHVINSVFSIFDLFLCSFPLRILTFWYSLIYGLLYLITNIVYWAVTDEPVYSITDWGNETGQAVGIAIGSLIMPVVLQFLLFMLYWLREVIRKNCGCEENKVYGEETTFTNTPV